MSKRIIALWFIALTVIASTASIAVHDVPNSTDGDEDLTFLEEEDSKPEADVHQDTFSDSDTDDNYDYADDHDPDSYLHDMPNANEKDVVLLNEGNFSDFIKENKFVMVEFYAPWCDHCRELAPEYAEAATELKSEGVALAKVDAMDEVDLAQEHDVNGYPTLFFFIDGEHKLYNGQKNKDAIITWIKKKMYPIVHNISSIDVAEKVLTSDGKVLLGYLNSLTGPESEELTAASRLEDDADFYQTVNPEVAKLFHLDPSTRRPALVLLKKEAEKINYFDGNFSKHAISEFIAVNRLPLVITFSKESASSIFESTIKKQMLLFTVSNEVDIFFPVFQEAAKSFKGKIVFVHVEMDDMEVGKPVADYFGVTGNSSKVMAYAGKDDSRKYLLKQNITTNIIEVFGNDFLQGKLDPFYKSDPIPKNNDEDVKIVVGHNFDEIVLDESKDVLLEIYAPWCGHCQSFEPTYNKFANYLRDVESIVVAKMDGTTNEHPRAKADGYPTILFFPAGSKSFEPVTVDTDRTVVALYKFIKKHASIPFRLPRPASVTPSHETATKATVDDVKHEL